ncbi:hypothetical protein V4D30_00950 [Thermodesulfovibrio sp. 3907-1M]|uniref:Uncharacterized protein n=1 Tax=Thermodesulfovibrio autotrophicus TaxID=3118333 RepID=A0AAU8GWX8_9BACT
MRLKQILVTVLISLVVSSGVVFVYDQFFSQKIVTFDLKGYVATLRDLYVTGQIDDKELQRRIDVVEAIVNSTPKRNVIITSDVILGGDRVKNLTPKIETRTKTSDGKN